MIVGILSGYYRSGTTAWQKAIKDSSDVLVLHEPFSPSLRTDIYKAGKKLHGWDVFDDYFKLEPVILAKLWRELRFSASPVVIDYEDVTTVLDILDKSEYDIIIKDNQMWLWLDRIKDDYGIPSIFLERNEYDILLAHVEIFPNPAKILNQKSSHDRCFYCDTVHRLLGGDLRRVRDKILWNATTAKEKAKCVHVKYEEPKTVAKAIENRFGIKVKKIVEPIKPRPSAKQ